MEGTDGDNSGSLIQIQDGEAFSLLELRPSQILRHISIVVDGRPLRISSPTLLGLLSQLGEWREQIALRECESNGDPNHTALRELSIEFPDVGLWGYRPVAGVMISLMVPVAEVIRCSLRLSKLNLRYYHKLTGSEVHALAVALKESSSLRVIQIEGLEEGMAEVLLKAFSSEDLEKLILKGHQWEGLRNVIAHILGANINHVEICLGIYVQPEIGRPEFLYEPHTFPWEEIGHALLQVRILKKLSLDIWVPARREQDDVDSRSCKWKNFLNGVKKMWEVSQQSPLINLSLFFSVQPINRDQSLIASVLLSLAGLKGVHLIVIPQGVSTSDDTGAERMMVEVMDTLNQIGSLEICTLRFSYPGAGMQMLPTFHPFVLRRIIFEKLSDNSSIEELTLDDSFFGEITEEDFREVLKCLTRNSTLQRVRVSYEAWIRDGKVALIQEALQRNVRQALDMSMMRQAGLQFSIKTAGRILLCGSPYAGKTRLRKTLVRTETREINYMLYKGLHVLGSVLPAHFGLPRTKGIEVTTLRDDADISITVWDLGGQWIFRALQDLLFPRTSHACIYLFVFSPVERVRGKVRKKDDLPSALEQELKSWLRFIASNSSSATAGLLPQVMIVISHKDKIPSCDRDLSWARSVVDNLKTSFQGVVNLSSSQDIQFINCHSCGDVSALKEFVFQQMNIIFLRSLVPSLGIELTTLLTRRPREVREYPVWSLDKLYAYICNQNAGGLHKLNPSLDTAIRTKVLNAVVGYLHDVGSIIIISHLVVVDPNWMTEKFLGELFSHGHDFEAGRSVVYRASFGRDGFIDSQTLSGFLATFVAHYERERINVLQDQLKDLLVELDLCFELDAVENPGNPRYFMPAVLGGAQEKLPARKLEWKFVRPEGAEHFGFRLQCDDRDRKCLTKSFFPTCQVKLRNHLVTNSRMDVAAVSCSLGLMMIHEDGNEIFVESDELAEDHIDIMVRSSPDKKETAVQFVEEKIISFLHGICKSDFVGISLSTSILRTECVVKLTPRDYRNDNQAISVRELEEKLEEKVRQWEQLSNDGTPRRIPETWVESCLTYEHTWPAINCKNSDVALLAAPEPIKEFLPREVLNKIKKNLMRIARNYDWSRRELRQTANEVRQLNDEVYEVYAPVSDNPRLEVIFVHGVPEDESDPEPYLTTWSKNNEDPDKCWLNTWLTSETEDLRLARVLSVTYDGGVRKTDHSGNMDNFLVAETLTESLITLARVGQHDCPVILVGHCLGGLVIKEVCREASRSVEARNHRATECDNFLNNVKGMFFYSTPHLGWSRKFSSELRMSDMMESLKLLSNHTSRVNYHFEQLRKKYRWRTRGVGESNKSTRIFSPKDGESTLMELVVGEASAREGSFEFCMVSDTDHFTICRPKSKKSNSFLYLVDFINQLLRKSMTETP